MFYLGLTADWTRVFAVAAELDKAAEIDSYPSQLEFIEFGLAAAESEDCPRPDFELMSPDDLARWAARLRDRGGIHKSNYQSSSRL